MRTFLSLFIVISTLFSPLSYAGDKVSPETVNGATTIDVRKDKDWEAGRIPNAAHIELKQKLNETSLQEETGKDDKVVFYCNGTSCLRSSKASTLAVSWGFKHVFYFSDGYPAWKTAGYPTE